MKRNPTSFVALCALALVVVSCGGDSKKESSFFAVTFESITQSNVSSAVLAAVSPINSVALKADVDLATLEFGQVPTAIRVKKAIMDLNPNVSSISGYEQVMTEITLFLSPKNGAVVNVGTQDKLEGNEAFTFDIDAKKEDFAAALIDYLNGDFSVGFSAPATGANVSSFNAKFEITIQFEFIK